jgi:hypothetical protein
MAYSIQNRGNPLTFIIEGGATTTIPSTGNDWQRFETLPAAVIERFETQQRATPSGDLRIRRVP